MPLDHLSCDRQAQSASARIAIARPVEAKKRLEYGFPFVGRDAWPVIVHPHDKSGAIAGQGNIASAAMGKRIVDQVAEQPFQHDRIGLQARILNFR